MYGIMFVYTHVTVIVFVCLCLLLLVHVRQIEWRINGEFVRASMHARSAFVIEEKETKSSCKRIESFNEMRETFFFKGTLLIPLPLFLLLILPLATHPICNGLFALRSLRFNKPPADTGRSVPSILQVFLLTGR